MKYNIFRIWLMLLMGLCFLSLNRAQGTQFPKQSPRIEIYDSLVIGGNSIYLTDYSSKTKLFLGYDYYTYDIIMFDIKGENIKRFNKYGEGPEEYNHSNSMTVKYWGEGAVVVRTNDKLKFYSFDGKFLGKTKTGDGASIAPRRQLFVYQDRNKDTNLVYYADKYSAYSMTEAGFYEDTSRRVIVNFNLETGKTSRFVGFEKGSVYLNGEEYYPDILPVFSLNYEKRLLDVVFKNGQKVYRYDIDDGFKLVATIDLNADNFGKLTGVPFGRKTNSYKIKQLNSSYIRIHSYGDTIVALYFKGRREEDVFSTVEKENASVGEVEKYMQVLVNGEKTCKDIKLPGNILVYNYIFDLTGKIIFKKAPNQYDEENNSNTFLIGKIVY